MWLFFPNPLSRAPPSSSVPQLWDLYLASEASCSGLAASLPPRTLVKYLTTGSIRPKSLLPVATEPISRCRRAPAGKLFRNLARAGAPRVL
jgi:hypothetical protein